MGPACPQKIAQSSKLRDRNGKEALWEGKTSSGPIFACAVSVCRSKYLLCLASKFVGGEAGFVRPLDMYRTYAAEMPLF